MKQIERRLIELESKYKATDERFHEKKTKEFMNKYGVHEVNFFILLSGNKFDSVFLEKYKDINLKAARKDYLEILKIGKEIEDKKNKLKDI